MHNINQNLHKILADFFGGIMEPRLIFANVVSFAAAIMLSLSCVYKSREKIYKFQLLECVLLIFAQILFGEFAPAAVLLFAAVRNFLLWKRKYSLSSAAVVFVLTFVFGFALSDGIVSLLPVIATLIYSLTTYFAKDFVKLKISLFINLCFWIIYSFLIFDISSFIINIISFALNFISLLRYKTATQ